MSFAVPPTSILNYWLNQSNNHASIQINRVDYMNSLCPLYMLILIYLSNNNKNKNNNPNEQIKEW